MGLRAHPGVRAARVAFQFWVLRWWFLALVWVFLEAKFQQSDLRWIVLGTVDFDSIFLTQGFCWTLILGDKLFKDEQLRRKLLFYLVLGFAFLCVWNFAWTGSVEQHIEFGQRWTLLSLILAAFDGFLIFYAFLLRYRWYSLVILLIQVPYAVLQVPAYSEAFSFQPAAYPRYSFILALLKLLSGVASYAMFILLPANFSPLGFAERIKARFGAFPGPGWLKSIIKTVLAGIGILLLHIAAEFAYHFVKARLAWIP